MSDPISPVESATRLTLTAGVVSTVEPKSHVDETAAQAPKSAVPTDDEKTDVTQGSLSSTKMALKDAAQSLNTYLNNASTDLQFKYDEDTGVATFKVINAKTHEIIREYPPKDVLGMAKRLKESLQSKTGVLMDKQQ